MGERFSLSNRKEMSAAPAFQFYPESFLAGTVLFTNEEKGIYMTLLCYQWSHGHLPSDLKLVAHMAGCSIKKLQRVLTKFIQDEKGGYYNERLEKEKIKQEAFRERQRQNGACGGRPPITQAFEKNNPSLSSGESPRDRDRDKESVAVGKGDWGKPIRPLLCLIQPAMQKDGFPEAWEQWIGYRAEMGETLTSYTAASVMGQCERWGAYKSVRLIRRSIKKSWKNILDDNEISQINGQKSRENYSVNHKIPVVPAWMILVEESQKLLTDPIANKARLLQIGNDLPREAWTFMGIDGNPLREILKSVN
jgi:uncharacterized protein YdaU (DUF1376 family)